MQKDGGEGIWKVPRISSSLLALKTETEGGDDMGHGLFFLFKDCTFNMVAKLIVVCNHLGDKDPSAMATLIYDKTRLFPLTIQPPDMKIVKFANSQDPDGV